MCRAEVAKVYQRREELKAFGAKLVCVFRENLPEEVAAFQADVWQGEPMFLDSQFQLFGALAGGEPNVWTNEGFMKTIKEPTPEEKVDRDRATALSAGFMTAEHHNMVGKGLMMGGVYVVQKGGAVEYAHHEQFVGDTVEDGEIVVAAVRAAMAPK